MIVFLVVLLLILPVEEQHSFVPKTDPCLTISSIGISCVVPAGVITCMLACLLRLYSMHTSLSLAPASCKSISL